MRRWWWIGCCAIAAEAGLMGPRLGDARAWSQVPAAVGIAAAAGPRGDAASTQPQGAAATDVSRPAIGQALKQARTLIRQRRFRAAEKLLLDQLNGAPQESMVSLEATLGEVYFRSGQDDKALSWLSRSLARYEHVRQPTLLMLAEESRVVGMLSDTYARQGQPADAIASLEQMLAHYNHKDVVDVPTQMNLVVRLAALRPDKPVPASARISLDDEIKWLTKRLQTDQSRGRIGAEDYVQAVVCLAQYQSLVMRPDLAIATLKDLIDKHSAALDPSDALALRARLADVYRKQGDLSREINVLEGALAKARTLQAASAHADADSRLRRMYDAAQLEQLLADALLRDGRLPPAAEHLESATHAYQAAQKQAALRARDAGDSEEISDTLLLERIVDVVDRLMELRGAGDISLLDNIHLHEELLARFGQSLLPSDPRIARVDISLDGLYLQNSQFDLARTRLAQARDYWSRYRPKNVPILVQTLDLLAETDLATSSRDSLQDAAGALAEAAALCDALPPADPLRGWVRLNLGRLKAAQGHYQQALDDFGQIVADRPGRSVSPRLRSLALLQLGLLYKEQLEFDEALKFCLQAMETRQADLPADHPERLEYLLALGELYAARNDAARHDDQSLQDVIQQADTISRQLPEDHPSRAAVLHLQAMVHYLSDQRHADADQRQAARSVWQQLATVCRRTGQQSVEARTLHYLARLDYLDWTAELKAWSDRLRSETSSGDDAEIKALKQRIREHNTRQTQLDHSRQEYRLAVEAYHQLADERYEVRQQAFQSLQEKLTAIQHEESSLNELAAALGQEREKLLKARDEAFARRGAVGGNDRSRWKELLAHGEQLEEQAIAELRATGLYPSLQHAALCNEAEILQAQSQLADAGQRGLLERALSALQEANEVIENPRAATFSGDFMRAEFFSQYQSAFDLQVQFRVQAGQFAEALVAAEQGRSRTLLDQLWPNAVHHSFSAERTARIVEQWRTSDQPLLYYYVGSAASYLFVLGGSRHEIQSFPLKAGAETGVSAPGSNASSAAIAEVVERLRNTFRNERSAREILSNPAIGLNVANASAVLMPPPVVEYLRQELARGASCVTVIPHQSVSQLPLESLLVGDEKSRCYLVECCPPIVYAPSLSVLADLERRRSASAMAPSLLTIGDPILAASKSDAAHGGSDPNSGLIELPETENECHDIARDFAGRFGDRSVVVLTQAAASEARFRAALRNGRFMFLHFATHGIVGVDRGQPFGRMVLTAPASLPASKSDDGFLDLDEIRNLDLAGCELTALSACNTNLGAAIGRQDTRGNGDGASLASRGAASRRLANTDTCFSLASAFLAAGSRRVLATQWEVADRSTKILIVSFFDKISREIAAGRSPNYAQLLAEARKDLRISHPEFDTPFHWAPFVLIGPALSPAPAQNRAGEPIAK